MSADPKDGTYFDPQETVDTMRELYPYFRIEDCRTDFVRQGNEFAHPYAEEAMSGDSSQVMAAQVNLMTSIEELKAMRDQYSDANKANWERINEEHPEFEDYGYWEDYYVPGCPEEPDAPEVHVLVRRIKPEFLPGPYPVIMPIAVGGLFMHDPYMFCNAPITKYFGCQLVVAEVRTYPDAEYPAAINDLHAVYQWMIDHAEELNIDTDRIVIEGASSGGQLAASLPFRLKRYDWCGGPMPRGVVLFDAFFDDRETTRSMRTINLGWDGIVNRAANMRYMGKNFASGFIGPEAYANHATVGECKGLPPYAIYVNQDHPGCDPGIEFMEKLNEAGDFVDFAMGGGCAHVGPLEQMARVGCLYIRDEDYEPTLGTDRLSRMEAFFVGNIKDFLEHDLRRSYE